MIVVAVILFAIGSWFVAVLCIGASVLFFRMQRTENRVGKRADEEIRRMSDKMHADWESRQQQVNDDD